MVQGRWGVEKSGSGRSSTDRSSTEERSSGKTSSKRHLLRPVSAIGGLDSSIRDSATSTLGSSTTNSTAIGSTVIYNPRCSLIKNEAENVRSSVPKATLLPPTQLYGRDTEKQQLASAIASARQHDKTKHHRSVVLVSGPSGVGKTILLDDTLKDINNIVTIGGKYDFSQTGVPYAGITQALRELCDHYIQTGISATQKQSLQEALGTTSVLALEPLLPTLKNLIGWEQNKDSISAGNTIEGDNDVESTTTIAHLGEAPQRFRFAIQTFLWTIATWQQPEESGQQHPSSIVMVLDDLQWADAESFRLLRDLTEIPSHASSDEETIGSSLVVVGCYRDDEASIQLGNWILDLTASNNQEISITRVPVSNLTVQATAGMLAHVLHVSKEEEERTREVQMLAGIVHTKTLGNPFFVFEFLKSLQQNGLVTFDLMEMRWTWNTDLLLASKTEATNNVVEHLKREMALLPQELSNFLPLAACLGSTFSSSKLEVVLASYGGDGGEGCVGNGRVSAYQWLRACVEKGFLAPCGTTEGEGLHTWVHDKIQEAALSLVPAEELEAVQFSVGKVLLHHLSRVEIRANILTVVNLLMKGLPKRSDMTEKERIEISKLCLEAGHTVMASASFSHAGAYLEAGIGFLPDNHWEVHHELSLELYTTAAEAESCGPGGNNNLQRYCNEVIKQQDLPVTDKFRAYDVLMLFTWAQNKDYQGASDMALHVLGELDCRLPKRAQLLHVLMGVAKMKRAMKKLGPDSILSHKEMTDPRRIQTIVMLSRLVTPAYQLKSLYLPLAILKSFDLTIKWGISEHSPSAIALVALILMAQLKDFDLSRTYANYAVNLVESRPNCEVSKSKTLFVAYGFVLHASVPYHDVAKRLLEGYRSGLATGDVEDACWNVMCYLIISLQVGKNLRSLHQDWKVYTKQMISLKQRQAAIQAKQDWQVAQNLLGLSEDPFILRGDAFSFEVREVETMVTSTAVSAYRAQLRLKYYMCDDIAGAEIVLELFSKYKEEDMDAGTFQYDCLAANAGVLCYGAARKTKKRKFLVRARKCHKHIQMVSKKGNPNLSPLEQLLDAEYAALRGRKSAAKNHYEAAVGLAARRGMVHEQAIANERLAAFIVDSLKDGNEAYYRYNKAIALYNEWGAIVKVQLLEERAASLMNEFGSANLSRREGSTAKGI